MLLVWVVGGGVGLGVVRWVGSLEHGVVGCRAKVVRGRIDRGEAGSMGVLRVVCVTLAHHIGQMEGHCRWLGGISQHAWRVHKSSMRDLIR